MEEFEEQPGTEEAFDAYVSCLYQLYLFGAAMQLNRMGYHMTKRNFEAGILTDDPEMVDAAIEQFDKVWIGKFCKDCGRREYCSDPIK
jgi:hypothetical protein